MLHTSDICSVAAHNIKAGWLHYAYDSHPRDKKWEVLNKDFI